MNDLGTTQFQKQLFDVERQIEFEEVEMGVLADGTPYLTGRGLEKMCGISHGQFHRFVTDWKKERYKPRGKIIQQLLDSQKYTRNELFLRANNKGIEILAFIEPVCMAILEYYAFHASDKREKALDTYRILARSKFRDFIYHAIGYTPHKIDPWKQFHDRVSLTYGSVPLGYFSIFKEIADMIVTIGKGGLYINDSFAPDISVGKSWAHHWRENKLSEKYGDFTKYDHSYPPYFPQAKSNPQKSNCYPEDALGEFRRWFREIYIGSGRFKKYLNNKVSDSTFPAEFANKAIEVYERILLLK